MSWTTAQRGEEGAAPMGTDGAAASASDGGVATAERKRRPELDGRRRPCSMLEVPSGEGKGEAAGLGREMGRGGQRDSSAGASQLRADPRGLRLAGELPTAAACCVPRRKEEEDPSVWTYFEMNLN
jgi:hypothetical protein